MSLLKGGFRGGLFVDGRFVEKKQDDSWRTIRGRTIRGGCFVERQLLEKGTTYVKRGHVIKIPLLAHELFIPSPHKRALEKFQNDYITEESAKKAEDQ